MIIDDLNSMCRIHYIQHVGLDRTTVVFRGTVVRNVRMLARAPRPNSILHFFFFLKHCRPTKYYVDKKRFWSTRLPADNRSWTPRQGSLMNGPVRLKRVALRQAMRTSKQQ